MDILRRADRLAAAAPDGEECAGAELARLRAQVAVLESERAALWWAIHHDDLTGLANRRLLNTVGPAMLRDATRYAVLVLDLNGFKPVNDRYGHAVGDVVLRRLAAVLRLCCREQDVLIRYGGDEFVILLDAGPERPEDVGRRVLDRVRAEPWAATTGVPSVTVSVGTATGPLAVETVHRSDAAMFAAKRAGRDGMVPR